MKVVVLIDDNEEEVAAVVRRYGFGEHPTLAPERPNHIPHPKRIICTVNPRDPPQKLTARNSLRARKHAYQKLKCYMT